MNGTGAPLVLGEPWNPNSYRAACACSGSLQGACLSSDAHRNGLLLGGESMCLGQSPCLQAEGKSRMPLAGPDPLTVTYESTPSGEMGKGHQVCGR